jgi:hypothetical protein
MADASKVVFSKMWVQVAARATKFKGYQIPCDIGAKKRGLVNNNLAQCSHKANDFRFHILLKCNEGLLSVACTYIYSLVRQLNAGQGRFFLEVSVTRTMTHQSVELPRTRDRPSQSLLPDNTHTQETDMTPAGFEAAV